MDNNTKPNWTPRVGPTFESKNIHGMTLVHEQVWFIPNINIHCSPPYIRGKPDTCWVKYLEGRRPHNQEAWQSEVGMSLITML